MRLPRRRDAVALAGWTAVAQDLLEHDDVGPPILQAITAPLGEGGKGTVYRAPL